MKQKVLIGISLCSLLVLTGCVSEQTYVGSDKPVSDRTFDNIEAARTRISLGLNYLRRGDTSQAKYNLERARSFAPNSAEVHSALAYYYQNVGENKQAEEYFRLAIQKDSNYADAYNNYGAFLCQLQRYEEAEQLLLKAISRPGYIRVAESYENLALCQLQQNHFTKASTYLDNSISHNTTRITSLTMAAGVAYAMGDNRQAKNLLDRIQRLGRVSARTVLLSYLIAEKNGDQEVMRNAEQLLLTLYTETPETRLLLQGKLQDSEFEQLRERYKDSLMANIVLPDDAAEKQPAPSMPVPNPKLKVVKRKGDDSQPAPGRTEAEPQLRNNASNIAQRLGNTATAAQAVPVQPVSLPAETVKTDKRYDKAAAEKARLQAEQEAAELLAAQQAKRKAEQEAAELLVAQQAKLKAEQEAAELLVAQQAKLKAEQEAAELLATQQAKLKAKQEAAELLVAQQAERKAEQDAAELLTAQQQKTEQDAALAGILGDAALVTAAANEETAQGQAGNTERLVSLPAESQTQALEATAGPDETAAESAALPEFHIVQTAESLYAISVQHNIRLQRLMEWNQLTPDSVIKTGQKIWLGPVSADLLVEPKAVNRNQMATTQPYHIVSEGETMFGISYQYNVRLSSFMAWNNFKENSTLKVGQQVYVVDPVSVEQ